MSISSTSFSPVFASAGTQPAVDSQAATYSQPETTVTGTPDYSVLFAPIQELLKGFVELAVGICVLVKSGNTPEGLRTGLSAIQQSLNDLARGGIDVANAVETIKYEQTNVPTPVAKESSVNDAPHRLTLTSAVRSESSVVNAQPQYSTLLPSLNELIGGLTDLIANIVLLARDKQDPAAGVSKIVQDLQLLAKGSLDFTTAYKALNA